MAHASSENRWELRTERVVPLKRHVAYRAAVNRIADWWWVPDGPPTSNLIIDWRANGVVRTLNEKNEVTDDWGSVLEVRPGWYFYMTDAIIARQPGNPSIVACWSFLTTPKDSALYVQSPDGNCSTFTATIRHFTEDDYFRNLARGLEQGWKASADRLVQMCNERPFPRY